jgi:hypothetical protein
METHKVEDVNRELYTVDGSLHTRKDLQLVKGNVIKAPTKTKAQQNKNDVQNKVDKAQQKPEVKDLIGNITKKAIKTALDTGITTRQQATYKLRSRK